jgi:hypothetical protein
MALPVKGDDTRKHRFFLFSGRIGLKERIGSWESARSRGGE